MVVAGFRRSLSFPNHPSRLPKPTRKTLHVRSASLPCRSHPLIPQLREELANLRKWESNADFRTSAWFCEGLSLLRTVHESLDDILSLSQTHELLAQSPQLVEKLLEDFLRFVDVYGIFQTLTLTLKQEQMAAQVAVRRRDDSNIASYVKALRKMSKEMSKLVCSVQSIARCSCSLVGLDDSEIAEVVRDVTEATVSVSVTVFKGILLSITPPKSPRIGIVLKLSRKPRKAEQGIQELQHVGVDSLWPMRRKGDEEVRMALKRLHDLEGSIANIQHGSERVFRSLINTRVSLLNVLTQ